MAIAQLDDRSQPTGPNINPARVFERVLRFWYIIVITLLVALAVAFIVNRYTTRIYPISASIIIRMPDENVGARFLYNNSLINPGRNYYNEFFIMRSYPLMQQVVEDLNFDVSFFVEGELKSKEYYLPDFPVRIEAVNGTALPYRKSFTFRIMSESEFYFQPKDKQEGSSVYRFNDTVAVNNSRIHFLKTDSVAKWIGKQFTLVFNDSYSLAKQYSNKLQLKWAEEGSAVIFLSLTGSVPDKEKAFLVKFIEYYQRYDVDKKQIIATKSIEFLDRQVRSISDSLRYYENSISTHELMRDYTRDRSVAKITTIGETLEAQDLQLRLQEQYYTYLEDYLKNQNEFDQVILPSALGVTDPIMSGLVSSLVAIQFEARLLKGQLSAGNNPLILDTKDRIAQYKRDIFEAIRSGREIMKLNQATYQARIAELQGSLSTISEPDKAISNIMRNYKLMESLYSFLIQKRAEAAISRASTTSDIIIVNHPEAGGPITPKPLVNYGIATALGLLLPIVIFVALEFFNTQVQSKEDIEAISSVPVIGTIGHKMSASNLSVFENPKSYLAESFRALRSNLNYFTEGKDKKIILVTSSISGEGKSFTSINLSTVIAFTGKRVVLIGGDMRKHEITKDMEVTNATGLSLFLSNQTGLSDIIQKTKIENLDFIPPGPTPPNPAELYLKPRVEELFSTLLTTYDYIIVDSPPVGLVSDALSLISIVDHVLFVTRQGYTPMSAISQLQYMVDQGQVQHVSIVLNDIKRIGMGYGYKHGYAYDYGYGYRYGHNRYYGKQEKSGYEGEINYNQEP